MHAGTTDHLAVHTTNVADDLRDRDIRHLWHPYTDANAYETSRFRCIERAEGSYLYEQDGRPILDGIASWWAAALGHGHPRIVEAIREQAGVLQHSILGRMTHPRAIELAERLAAITPDGLEHVYFASDGASATEAALKMAIQFWANQGRPERHKFVALDEGYHGDTLGAVGVGFVPSFHWPFEHSVCKAHFAEAPHLAKTATDDEDRDYAIAAFASMERIVREHHAELAGVIVEPLCQGAAGVRIYHPEYLRRLRELCDEYELILIADEIAVGFARTGKMFACDHAEITPDIMCFGKALTGGYLPMSATIVTDRVYDAFRSDASMDRTFYDGHTFCGNPITAAAALAAIDEYEQQDIVHASGAASSQLAETMARVSAHDAVAYQKTLGMIGMAAFTNEAGGADFARRASERAWDLGLFIRPLGNVLYLWPPLNVSEAELAEMGALFDRSIQEASV